MMSYGAKESNIDLYKRHVISQASPQELAEIVSNGGMSIPIPIKNSSPGRRDSKFTKVFVSGFNKFNTASKIPKRADLSSTMLPGDVARSEPKSLIDFAR
jgi:hypothetical protein